jgi:hypothetical protein
VSANCRRRCSTVTCSPRRIASRPNMVTNLDGLQRAIDIQSELSFLKGRIDIKSHADLRIVLEAGKRVN